MSDYSARFTFVRKFDKDLQQTVNSSLPYSAYTQSVNVLDVGPDNVSGTADDRQIPVFSVPKTDSRFGERTDFRTNVEGAGSNYTSFEGSFNKRMSDGWMMLFSYNHDFVDTRSSMPMNPNADIYEDDRGFYQWAFKVMSTVELPYGINFAPVWKSQKGRQFDRTVRIRDANNSSVTLTVARDGEEARGGGTYGNVHMMDFRVSKTFDINDRHSVEAMFDYFNVFNGNTITSQGNRNGSTFHRPSQILGPSIFRLGARWKF